MLMEKRSTAHETCNKKLTLVSMPAGPLLRGNMLTASWLSLRIFSLYMAIHLSSLPCIIFPLNYILQCMWRAVSPQLYIICLDCYFSAYSFETLTI